VHLNVAVSSGGYESHFVLRGAFIGEYGGVWEDVQGAYGTECMEGGHCERREAAGRVVCEKIVSEEHVVVCQDEVLSLGADGDGSEVAKYALDASKDCLSKRTRNVSAYQSARRSKCVVRRTRCVATIAVELVSVVAKFARVGLAIAACQRGRDAGLDIGEALWGPLSIHRHPGEP